jgi:hypothetical protein
MGADVEQDDLFLIKPQDEDDAILIGQTYGMFSPVAAPQGVEAKAGCAGISFQLPQHVIEYAPQIRMPTQEFAGSADKRRRPDQRVPRG